MKNYSKVDIWIGTFDSLSDFEKYSECTYSDNNDTDDSAISKFCEDIGLWFYDEDFQEFKFMDSDFNVENVLDKSSWSDSYKQAFIDKMKALRNPQFNAIFLIWNHDNTNKYSGFVGNSAPIKYVGRFDCVGPS